MIVLWIILWILAGLLGLVLLLVLVPLGATAGGTAMDLEAGGDFRIWWGFGLLQLRGGSGEKPHLRLAGIRVKTMGRGDAGNDDDDDDAKDTRKAKKKRSSPGLRWFLRHRRTLLWAVSRLLGSFRLEGRIRGSFGTGGPADTAAVWGILQMLEGRTALLHLEISPRYVEEGWDLEGDVRFGVWPIRTAVAALGLYLRRDVRRAIKTARI